MFLNVALVPAGFEIALPRNTSSSFATPASAAYYVFISDVESLAVRPLIVDVMMRVPPAANINIERRTAVIRAAPRSPRLSRKRSFGFVDLIE